MTMELPTSFRIAVVEDDHLMRHDLVDFLIWKGHRVMGCESAESFLALYQRAPVDLVLLDIGLPGRDGLTVVRHLRELPNSPGIVVLTAFNEDQIRIQGLQEGADAYLLKGASLELIEATCLSVMRRLKPSLPKPPTPANDDAGVTWALDVTRARLLAPGGQLISLTHSEVTFLHALIGSLGQAVSRQFLLQTMGKIESYSSLRNLDNCATRLRRKVLEEAGLELPIRACYGVGYAFADDANVRLTS
jgi:two-component system, OmpR family, response regulator